MSQGEPFHHLLLSKFCIIKIILTPCTGRDIQVIPALFSPCHWWFYRPLSMWLLVVLSSGWRVLIYLASHLSLFICPFLYLITSYEQIYFIQAVCDCFFFLLLISRKRKCNVQIRHLNTLAETLAKKIYSCIYLKGSIFMKGKSIFPTFTCS